MRTGIFGGSFNPVHLGHLIITDRFRESLNLDKVLLVPSNISPFKVGMKEEYAPASDRIAMLKLAFASVTYAEVDTFEITKAGISYSADTIEYLANKYAGAELFFLIGEDQAEKFSKWKTPRRIASLAQICIAGRDLQTMVAKKIEETFAEIDVKPIQINSPIIEISSSEIRRRIRENKSINFLTPPEVADYIRTHKLYL